MRYLFSLVSIGDNSDNAIQRHIYEEGKLLFLDKDNYSIILIDDIDIDKIKILKKEHYKLNKIITIFHKFHLKERLLICV